MLPEKDAFGFEANDGPMSTLDRVDFLASALMDEAITDPQFSELSGLLEDDSKARSRYVENVRLHVDLMHFFGSGPDFSAEASLKSPVLGMLGVDPSTNPEDSGIQLPLPGAGEAPQ